VVVCCFGQFCGIIVALLGYGVLLSAALLGYGVLLYAALLDLNQARHNIMTNCSTFNTFFLSTFTSILIPQENEYNEKQH
jgi:hypothetical protein|tara:strand:- start:24 stop:263 length:240 start_codon:yes stop_codon:yes gene_type:complete